MNTRHAATNQIPSNTTLHREQSKQTRNANLKVNREVVKRRTKKIELRKRWRLIMDHGVMNTRHAATNQIPHHIGSEANRRETQI